MKKHDIFSIFKLYAHVTPEFVKQF